MPSYDYRCTACDERFEVTRSMGAKDAVCCPRCGSDTKRVFSPVGVAFKGSGFHNTDYKKSSESASESCPQSRGEACPAAGA